MQIAGSLGRTALAFGLAVVAPVAAVAVPFVNIDESVEGAPPTITSNAPGFIVILGPNPTAAEGWAIGFTLAGNVSTVGPGGNLTEPNSTQISDSLVLQSSSIAGNTTSLLYQVNSDDQQGNLSSSCADPTCLNLTENGDFQTLDQAFDPNGNLIADINLKSDPDLPEPPSLILLLTALLTFAVSARARLRI